MFKLSNFDVVLFFELIALRVFGIISRYFLYLIQFLRYTNAKKDKKNVNFQNFEQNDHLYGLQKT